VNQGINNGVAESSVTLRRRIALAVLASCTVAVVVLYFTVQSILAAHCATLEKRKAGQDIERALAALSQDVANIEGAVGVWAPWDDTYQFMQDGNADYITSNLNSSTLLNLSIDFIVYVNPAGQIAYSKALDSSNGAETPIPPGLEQFVTGEGLLSKHDSETGKVAGVLFLPEHLALVASQPILTSQKEGPIAGSLVMGRYLDLEEAQRISEAADLSVELHRVDEADIPPDFEAARSSLSEQQSSVVRVLDGKTVAAYALVSEIHGNPAFVLGIHEARDIHAQGQRTAHHILYLLLGLSALFTLLVILGIDFAVMSRLRRLSASVKAASESLNFSDRVSVSGKDEVAAVADAVNITLALLEQSRHDLAESEARKRALVEAIPDLVFRMDGDGKISDTRRPQKVAAASDNGEGARGTEDDIIDLMPAHMQQMTLPCVTEALKSRQTQVFEFQMSVDGSTSHHEARVVANSDHDALIMVRDVTAQKHEEEARQNTVLLKEIHNRIKNHLQVIRAFPEARRHEAAGPIGTTEQARSGPHNAIRAEEGQSADTERGESEPVGTTTQVK
jgi:sensor domain CHASE-containing protein